MLNENLRNVCCLVVKYNIGTCFLQDFEFLWRARGRDDFQMRSGETNIFDEKAVERTRTKVSINGIPLVSERYRAYVPTGPAAELTKSVLLVLAFSAANAFQAL